MLNYSLHSKTQVLQRITAAQMIYIQMQDGVLKTLRTKGGREQSQHITLYCFSNHIKGGWCQTLEVGCRTPT